MNVRCVLHCSAQLPDDVDAIRRCFELPLASILLKRLSSSLLDHPLDGNSRNNLIELHFFSVRKFSLSCGNIAQCRRHAGNIPATEGNKTHY